MIVGVAICTNRPQRLADTLHENAVHGLPVIVIAGDTAPRARRHLRTEDHPFAAPASWDLWRRRNAALDAARALGWEALLLLDDDIRGLSWAQLDDATRVLGVQPLASWAVWDEIDTSCVGHCSIALGHKEAPPAASGACMLVRMEHASHFPPVYNEDLLFAREASMRDDGTFGCANMGIVRQIAQHDRFDVARARSQEFGDVLCEGLEFTRRAMLGGTDGAQVRGRQFLASEKPWRWALERRREELDGLIAEALHGHACECDIVHSVKAARCYGCGVDPSRVHRALTAARKVNATITPEHLRSFYVAWRADVAEDR